MLYKVEITEVLQKTIEVTAKTETKALEIVEKQWNEADIEPLGSDDFVDVTFTIVL